MDFRIGLVYRYRPWNTGDFLRRVFEKYYLTWVIDTERFKSEWYKLFTTENPCKLNAIVGVGLQDLLNEQELSKINMPKILWAMDDPYTLSRNLMMAPYFDHVFVTQTGVLKAYESIVKCSLLPFACDNIVHQYLPFSTNRDDYEYDIVFAGNMYSGIYEKRKEWLDELGKKFRVCYTFGGGTYMQTLVNLFKKAPIVYNNSLATDVNMRIFETLGCNRLSITDDSSAINGLFDIFQDDTHIVTYNTYEQLEKKVGYYLDHLEEAQKIADAGYKLVHSKYNYDIVGMEILKKLKELTNAK